MSTIAVLRVVEIMRLDSVSIRPFGTRLSTIDTSAQAAVKS
jgi:hypothetical protein